MTTPEPAKEPINLHIHPSLQEFNVSIPTWLAASKGKFNRLACQAFIFATPPSTPSAPSTNENEPHLLILHRAADDDHFPSLWETPGGTAEAATDPTPLHALARELFGETGLHVTRFLAQVGNGSKFIHREKGTATLWYGAKLSFVVEVAEIHGGGVDGGDGAKEEYLKGIPVVLNLEEHQAFEWATEARVRDGFKELIDGSEPEERTVAPDDFLKQRMLDAFAIVKASKGE
ncbi:MAG: hypothetical protein Q9203_003349 [Teloschistes exilis]